MPSIKDQLILHEGLEIELYKCPAGHWTIGVGRNLEADPLSQEEVLELLKEQGVTKEIAIKWLDEKIDEITDQLEQYDWYCSLDDIRKKVIIDMVFNLGIDGLLSFENMINALKEEDFEKAAEEMKDSQWYHQVKIRGKRLVKMMRTGEDYQ
ncbi:glycoside hydrolase family protein [Sporohalobacter salinus]|uniref:glycoside hydrolase family protein n=1 Tax=Sporohalobacter salinus TaxID=1494606 RepID=UPI00195FEF1A|nr:glycoside hydrolase family protein [Sporohalobacter salinus]MBM7624792.1 lysozyme [Sporohalobacter salinus]